jgi:hypothetical protein
VFRIEIVRIAIDTIKKNHLGVKQINGSQIKNLTWNLVKRVKRNNTVLKEIGAREAKIITA